ncbi:lytic transglycosylase domain-containing protein [Methylibium petroleiphilum]|uniref:Transglycosylase SLT domain-containing protein n=1 Tax=Methylibium petroleiphilum (strain ATCC BAA-1232 / LMG 22953 / PM1) TaxID=420662 RepID=A2SMQ0_METPP|nr:lytic transglycosylase domain-containing protein [Methylibium petroleiphilum]ABM96839.1 hypothetical protein Mpe_B0060 [Methylibium petroleiphilum PM1]
MLEAVAIDLAQRASVAEVRSSPGAAAQPAWYRPVTAQCLVEEAGRQRLELVKLLAVMKAEGGRVGMFSRNTDGSYDIGPMQVNTIHLPELAKLFNRSAGEVARLMAYDGCFNVAVGAWLLRKRTNEADGDFWYGIGRYHSKTPVHSTRYILRVHSVMQDIVKKSLADDAKARTVTYAGAAAPEQQGQ